MWLGHGRGAVVAGAAGVAEGTEGEGRREGREAAGGQVP